MENEFVPDEPIKEKYCQRCNHWKALTEFFKRGKKSKYYAAYCKDCHDKPFKYEKIVCPHCKEKIAFYGIDTKGNFVKSKNDILVRLRKEAKQQIKANLEKKKAVKKTADLKKVFEDD